METLREEKINLRAQRFDTAPTMNRKKRPFGGATFITGLDVEQVFRLPIICSNNSQAEQTSSLFFDSNEDTREHRKHE